MQHEAAEISEDVLEKLGVKRAKNTIKYTFPDDLRDTLKAAIEKEEKTEAEKRIEKVLTMDVVRKGK